MMLNKRNLIIAISLILMATVNSFAAISFKPLKKEVKASASWVDHYFNIQSLYDNADLRSTKKGYAVCA